MSEEPPLDPAPEPTNEVKGMSEDDLDDLLSQATELASEISSETGESEARPSPFELSSDPSMEIDAQLDEMEDLARTTGDELGAKPEASAPPEPSQTTGQPSEATAAPSGEVPDFMRELTAPDAETPESEESPQSNAWMAADLSEPAPSSAQDPTSPAPGAGEPPGEPGGAAAGAPARRATEPAGDGQRRGGGRKVLSLVAALAGVGVTALEVADKPFGMIGGSVRQLIGWIAIATTATSLIVLVISLF